MSEKKVLLFAASLSFYYPPRQRVNPTLVRTLSTHYAVTEAKLYNLNFIVMLRQYITFLGRIKISMSLIIFYLQI